MIPSRMIGYLTPRDGVYAFMKVWEIRQDEAPQYNPDDFMEYFWLTSAVLLQRLADGEKSKSDLPKLIRIFYGA